MKPRIVARTALDNSPDNSPDNSLDIADAAARLGLSTETVRKRLQRGKIKGYKTPHGVWRVLLPTLDTPGQQPGQSSDNSPDSSAPLVTALRDEIAFLRSQLQARDEEVRRAHILLQQSQQQVLQLADQRPAEPERQRNWLARLFRR